MNTFVTVHLKEITDWSVTAINNGCILFLHYCIIYIYIYWKFDVASKRFFFFLNYHHTIQFDRWSQVLKKIYCHYVQCKCIMVMVAVDSQHAAFRCNIRNLHCHGNIRSHACFFSSSGFNFRFTKWPNRLQFSAFHIAQTLLNLFCS